MMKKMVLALLLSAGSVYGQVRDVIVPNYVTGGKDEPKVVFLQNQEYPEIYDILYSDTVDIAFYKMMFSSCTDTLGTIDNGFVLDIEPILLYDFIAVGVVNPEAERPRYMLLK